MMSFNADATTRANELATQKVPALLFSDKEGATQSSSIRNETEDLGASTPRKSTRMSMKTSSTKTTSFNLRNKKSVRFGTITIREYPIRPGDNPGARAGPPLTMDWRHQRQVEASVDDYETKRPRRRTAAEMCIPPIVRFDLLKNQGFPTSEIRESQKAANIVRSHRKRDIELQHTTGMQEFTERLKRATLNATLKRSKKQQERAYLQHFSRSKHRDSLEAVKTTLKTDDASTKTMKEEEECTDEEK